MSDDLADLRGLADDIFASLGADALLVPEVAPVWNPPLWEALADAGLTLLSTPDGAGGSGAGIAESSTVIEEAARFAAPIPVAECDLLAAWLLSTAGRSVPAGPLTSACAAVELSPAVAGTTRVSGVAQRVPWARDCDAVVVCGTTGDRAVLVVVPTASASIEPGVNLAHEPRDTVGFDLEVADDELVELPAGTSEQWSYRAALGRSAGTVGALEGAVALTTEHAIERVQFGRALAKFQAVQHLIAVAAGEVTAARAAHDAAVRAVEVDGFDSTRAHFAVAVAKAQAARAARQVTAIAHQVHGAIGFTLDHQLRHFTLRALAYSSEAGGEAQWNRRIGELVLDEPSLWLAVTGLS
ncbi:MAG TPA: acyl-CoA dehydrogenase family protein [Gordonia sp. (in: high G+C Gram-positive bacteria)]|uniref:acyl-CoA dehydrogenase family protein n=1 Tax=unclassified Gordonia (in: high G+C Gram-positive bacteria) TaxID=2657482 RepID=UPI000FC38E1A|nr:MULTISPECIES: acyl-CoA dehydrogenase family protein [unclassified Gordonia (in: high G+C Gram-positive bacteria)]RUP39415.1 MAG: acyl-CoA dehydrogenase [Gordonia sp. (in: high G+C Gram-positive bacteria)]HNP56767.1 acyl-CoA dehydrogenase family protein [Gordonia sp. (in: high G+C Gram-positive bacteria)]HRC49890.1 acyl-CoA dehydrogenase family protein [Gordonia sp. (in: high G+C Gram-positive bacteria)]